MADESKDKTAWDYIKDGFKPASARADEEVEENRKAVGNQYQQDQSQGAQYVREKFKKGFFGQ